MERYTKTLSAHLLLVTEHAEFLARRLIFHYKNYDKMVQKYVFTGEDHPVIELDIVKQMMAIGRKAKEIQLELECIEETLKKTNKEAYGIYEILKPKELSEFDHWSLKEEDL